MFDSLPNEMSTKVIQNFLDYSEGYSYIIIKGFVADGYIEPFKKMSGWRESRMPALYRKTGKEYVPTTTKKETPMALSPVDTVAAKKSNATVAISLTDHPTLLERIKAEFLAMTNEEKAKFVTDFIPSIDPKELLEFLNVAYPKPLKFADVRAKDLLFHPLLGNVAVERVTEDRLCFSANGTKWLTDKDGYVDGNRNKKPVLFFDIDDYIKSMTQGG